MTDQLKTVMSKFFHTTEDKIVDRLLAESFASQESVPDPISDALSPLEKISLQNASNIARYVENPVQNVLDSHNTQELQEYREAIMSEGVESPEKQRVGKRKLGDKVFRTGVRTKKAKTLPRDS